MAQLNAEMLKCCENSGFWHFLWQTQRKPTEVIRGLKPMKTSRESWSYSAWGRESLRNSLLRTLQYIKGDCEKDGERCFTRDRSDRTKSNSLN